jgi:hypothetical protein
LWNWGNGSWDDRHLRDWCDDGWYIGLNMLNLAVRNLMEIASIGLNMLKLTVRNLLNGRHCRNSGLNGRTFWSDRWGVIW